LFSYEDAPKAYAFFVNKNRAVSWFIPHRINKEGSSDGRLIKFSFTIERFNGIML